MALDSGARVWEVIRITRAPDWENNAHFEQKIYLMAPYQPSESDFFTFYEGEEMHLISVEEIKEINYQEGEF